MKTVYILAMLSLVITACGTTRMQLTATAAVAQAQTQIAASTNTLGAVPSETPPPAPTTALTLTTEPTPSATLTTPEEPGTDSFTDPDASSNQLIANVIAHARSVSRDITYCTVGTVALKMDLYFPKSPSGPTSLAIFIHGGGWSKGDKVGRQVLQDAPDLLDAGFTVAALNYRLAPEYQFPAMIEDVKCAVRSLRAHADDYHIDPEKIGVWGTSAGGHLVNLLGTTESSVGFEVGEYPEQSSRVQAVVDMFGPTDLTIDFSRAVTNLKETVFGSFDLAQASPVTYVTADDPPFLILHGDADHLVPLSQSQQFYDALIAAGVEAQLVIVQGGNHGFTLPNQSPTRAELTTMIVDFFEAHLK